MLQRQTSFVGLLVLVALVAFNSLGLSQVTMEVANAEPAVATSYKSNTSIAAAAVRADTEIRPINTLMDASRASQGVIDVNYNRTRKGKLRIEKDGQQYTYDLAVGSQHAAFPLQLGSGQYTIRIYEHVAANRYRVILQEKVVASLPKTEGVYLHSVQLINWQTTDKPIVKAEELVHDKMTDREKLIALHGEVIRRVSYDYQKLAEVKADYLPDISRVWTLGKGICYDYASLLASMLRSQGMPTKLVTGYSPNIQGYHAWNEVYLADEGRWVIVDATFDAQILAAGQSYQLFKPSSQYEKVYEY